MTASETAFLQAGNLGELSTIIGITFPAAVFLDPTYFFEPWGAGSTPNTVKLKLSLAIIVKQYHQPQENPYHSIQE
jgi:hypothetical protein